ncbi:MAG: hypothetical protein WEB60_10015 [Terrimicrobiaceae bacterium]
MTENVLLVLGVAVMGVAFRSLGHPVLFRLGSWTVVGASFLAGWLLAGSVLVGGFLAVSWFFLPWVEFVFRLRNIRIPLERAFEPQTPPSRSVFPQFHELTDEVEAEGFDHVADVGWEDDHMRQFYRVFRNEASTTQACICFAEEGDLAFFYLTLTSRTPAGRAFLSWNYPFAYGLKFSPMVRLNRLPATTTFADMTKEHLRFLREEGIADGAMEKFDAQQLVGAIQHDLQRHVRHNLDIGILAKDGENLIRYTFRGMFFLWVQFLRDAVRIF